MRQTTIQIRLKRLAKLQQQAEEQKAAAAEANNAASSTPTNSQSTASSKPIQSSTPTPPAKPVTTPTNVCTHLSPRSTCSFHMLIGILYSQSPQHLLTALQHPNLYRHPLQKHLQRASKTGKTRCYHVSCK